MAILRSLGMTETIARDKSVLRCEIAAKLALDSKWRERVVQGWWTVINRALFDKRSVLALRISNQQVVSGWEALF